ncbi:metal-dependent hydrolase family protein [Streptomyces hygroscopicus]|uniref:metal-dependent hydrolase family protein n=1 Tax=Streptomyces hygroscopicus TaxID=1912 RepID=UPI000767708B|nr:amidohydrolase family protein [Streptomyces hygroscopicus]GLV75954.1 Xaa-Pro dipeptidase [Streptomyces hygroscopicus subsp. hygroscopicus]
MSPSTSILLTNVRVFDSSGSEPYAGEVLITGERIAEVRRGSGDLPRDGVRVVDGRGQFLMSGLCDAHTHFSWTNSADLPGLGTLGVEEHTLLSARSAITYLNCGYTMCVGAASAKPRLDVVIRDAINDGLLAGPRYLANCQEIAVTGGALVDGITAFADGPEEMRKRVRTNVALGADLVKLSMSGEEITGNQHAEDNYFSDEEVLAATTEAHRRGLRVCTHARSAESVKMSLRNNVDIIYHASFVDEEGLDMLEARKDEVFVAPGLNWLVATLKDAAAFGYPPEAAEAAGYRRELECAIAGLREMRRRGIRVLPGGDYGFAWTPHGTYARDLQHFVELLGYTPMETLLAATRLGGEIMRMPDELGQIKPGFYADLILVDGDPLKDITVLQNRDKIVGIMKGGVFHKDPDRSTTENVPDVADQPVIVNA